MTREEYEQQQERLKVDVADARKALRRAQAHFDELCEQSAELRRTFMNQEQQ